jgi:hypothetical protein
VPLLLDFILLTLTNNQHTHNTLRLTVRRCGCLCAAGSRCSALCGYTLSVRVLLCALRCPVRVVAGPRDFGTEFSSFAPTKVSDAVVCLDDAVTVRAKMQMMSRHHFAQLFRNCSIYLLLLLLMISEHKVCVFYFY